MSNKPNTVPLWATDTNYPAGAEPEAGTATKVPLSTGQAAHGWRPKQKPPAQEFNTQLGAIGDWLQYVSDGDFEDDTSISDGDLELADGELIVTQGNVYLKAATAFDLWSPTTHYDVGDKIQHAGKRYICITAGTTAGSGGPTTDSPNITDGTAHWKCLGIGDGAGRYYHDSEEILLLDVEAFQCHDGSGAFDDSGFFQSSGAGKIRAFIPLPRGRQIMLVSPVINGNGTANVGVSLDYNAGAGSVTPVANVLVTGASAGWTVGPGDLDLSAGDDGLIKNGPMRLTLSYNAAGVKFSTVTVLYTYPPPTA